MEPHDPDGLAAALERLLTDDELAARLATAARERVERRFDLRAEAGKVGDLIAESIGA